MAREIVASVYQGLGGSVIEKVLAASTYFKFWPMRVINDGLSIDQVNDSLPSPPTGWSSGDTLTLFGDPLVDQQSFFPEGGSAVTLNGTSQYMASVYDETLDPSDIGPQTLIAALIIHAVPGVGIEPVIAGGSLEFALTVRSDGRIYGYYNGSAVADLPFTVDVPLFIALTRSDGSPDSITLYVNDLIDSATPTNGTINRGYFHAGKHWSNAHYLQATYSLLGFHAAELTAAHIEELYDATVWTDVSSDVEIDPPITWERGIRDDSPIARVAATGTATYVLDNSERNSVGLLGYYTPGHVNCRSGFQKGIPCKITMSVGATEYDQFVGRIRGVMPEPDIYGNRRTHITVTDWMDEAARFRLAGTSILVNVRSDDVIRSIVARMPNQPHGLTFHQGSETYDLALDNTRDEAVPALEEFVRVHSSEVGRTWVSRSGELVCESRYTRPLFHADVQADIGEQMTEMEASETTDATVNRVQVIVHPRRVDPLPSTVLFTLERAIEIHTGQTHVFTATYVSVTPDGMAAERVGGLEVALSSYSANELTNGTGDSRSTSVVVSVRPDANSAQITVTNTNTVVGPTSGTSTVHLRTLILVGRGVYDFQPIPLVDEDAEAIQRDGVNTVLFDMGYQENVSVGRTIARALRLGYQLDAMRPRVVTVCANEEDLPDDLLALDVSDRIALAESMTALDGEFYINGVRGEYSEGVKCDLSWWLSTTAEGEALMAWQDVEHNAANFTADASTWGVDSADQVYCKFKRSGEDSIAVAFSINGSDVGAGNAELRIAIPGGFVPTLTTLVGSAFIINAGGASELGFVFVSAGVGYLQIKRNGGSAWTSTTSDNTQVWATTADFQIQT